MKRRRSLTHLGGTVQSSGDRDLAARLAAALDVKPAPEPAATGAATDDVDRAHVHGFHTYPARMHPSTAGRLVAAVTASGATVLDPFCGSGTVLVETIAAGRRAVGTDLNPLAVRLARLKTTPRDQREREFLVRAARAVAAFADERRERRAGATRRYGREDVETFDPHVLLELDSIRAGIADMNADAATADALALVLSAILIKVSRRASDTSRREQPRRIAAGFAARLFVRKADELALRLADYSARLPADALPARVEIDDATQLRSVPASSVDAIVTSPPYLATYDYLAHHELRMRWLGLDARPLVKGEIGARRRYEHLASGPARDTWSRELGRALEAMARACRRGARVVLILADSAVGSDAIRADSVVSAVAAHAGLRWLASASQERPHFHGPTAAAFRLAPRSEHAIALEKR